MSKAPGGTPPPRSAVALRFALAAALSFVDAACRDELHRSELASWMRRYLVDPGIAPMPEVVREDGMGEVPLTAPPDAAREACAARIVAAARVRVATTLAGLLAHPIDDRFLAGAIFAGRVNRVTTPLGRAWRPTPSADDRLSDVVLAFFAADALDHRHQYDVELCVCELCGRVSFAAGVLRRRRCAEHAR